MCFSHFAEKKPRNIINQHFLGHRLVIFYSFRRFLILAAILMNFWLVYPRSRKMLLKLHDFFPGFFVFVLRSFVRNCRLIAATVQPEFFDLWTSIIETELPASTSHYKNLTTIKISSKSANWKGVKSYWMPDSHKKVTS